MGLLRDCTTSPINRLHSSNLEQCYPGQPPHYPDQSGQTQPDQAVKKSPRFLPVNKHRHRGITRAEQGGAGEGGGAVPSVQLQLPSSCQLHPALNMPAAKFKVGEPRAASRPNVAPSAKFSPPSGQILKFIPHYEYVSCLGRVW